MSTLMRETEVAKRLNVSLASIRRWRLERRGPAFVKVGALVRYRPEELDDWLSELPTGGSTKTAHNGQQTPCARTRKPYLQVAGDSRFLR